MKDERTELRERRTASTKTYENPDHSFTKEIYLSPVHYLDLCQYIGHKKLNFFMQLR